jgi:tetratricopeptide (TPR) repeat protein
MVDRLMGDVATNVGQTVGTLNAPTPTATQDPGDNRRLAEAAWEDGSFQEAVRLYQSVLPALPNDLRAHYYTTLGLVMQGRYTDAVASAENTVTANPFASDAWAIRAMALNRTGELNASIVSAQRAIELDPTNARAHAYLAESLADAGYFTRAQQEIDRSLEADPESYEAIYVSGMYEWEVNFDFLAARNALEDAYDLSDGAAHVGLNLARLLLSAFEDIDGGTAILRDVLERNPDNAAVLYQLGTFAWRRLGDSEQAETYLRRCVAAVPDDLFCQYELGRVLNNLGNVEEARSAFARVIDLGSTNPYHYWWAGQLEITTTANCGAAMRFFQPGYQVLQGELASGSTLYNSTEALETLLGDYESAMSPCVSGLPPPVEDPTAEPGA